MLIPLMVLVRLRPGDDNAVVQLGNAASVVAAEVKVESMYPTCITCDAIFL